jgi:hypothetical protein
MTTQEKIARKLDTLQSSYDVLMAECHIYTDRNETVPFSLMSDVSFARERLVSFATYWSLDYDA